MRFTPAQKHRVYTELAKMVGAGFSVDAAAKAILTHRLREGQRRYLEGIRSGLAAKQTVSDAVAGAGFEATPLEISIVTAGEQGGRLDDAFAHLSDYFGMIDRTARRLRASLIYPIVLLHAAVILPAIPRALMSGSLATAGSQILGTFAVLYAGIAVLYFGGRALARAGRTQPGPDRLLNAIPLIGKARRSLALGRWCRVFHIHLLAAFPITRCLRAAGESSQSGSLVEASEHAAEAIRMGTSLSESIAGEGAIPPDLKASLGTAEMTGTIDVDLERWSRTYESDAAAALDTTSGWLPRIFYVLVALYVIWQIFGMALGYMGALQGVMDESF